MPPPGPPLASLCSRGGGWRCDSDRLRTNTKPGRKIPLELCGKTDEAERPRVFKKLRKWLKAGRWQKVVHELIDLMLEKGLDETAPVWTEITYLERHGKAGRLAYATFCRRKLPMGSGAIESAIRRVINLRIKGNSIFWKEQNAEGMLVLRGLVLSRRWPETFAQITKSLAHDRRLGWQWQSPDMVAELKAAIEIKPPSPQTPSTSDGYATAA